MTAVVEAQTAASRSSSNGNGNAATAGANGGIGGKLHGYAFYESIGRPKFVIAPMVDQSELVSLVLIIWLGVLLESSRRRGGSAFGVSAVRLSCSQKLISSLYSFHPFCSFHSDLRLCFERRVSTNMDMVSGIGKCMELACELVYRMSWEL